MKLLNLILVIVALSLTSYYGIVKSENSDTVQLVSKGDISVTQAAKMIEENVDNHDFLILDVSTPEEFATGRLRNAILINFNSDDFRTRVEKLDKSKKILVYCKKGGRSAKAKSIMEAVGFIEVYNMLGGITEWKVKGFEML